jgi:hypothetical protein
MFNLASNARGQKVFEGEVRSEGGTANFPEISYCLIKAMFEGFPGQDGTTRRVSIPAEECAR